MGQAITTVIWWHKNTNWEYIKVLMCEKLWQENKEMNPEKKIKMNHIHKKEKAKHQWGW